MWFFHALTGSRWLLDTTYRVPPGTFDGGKLEAALGLRTLDERTDLPIYGQEPRVRVRQSHRGFDDVRIHIHDRAEIDTPAFRRFLKRAVPAHVDMIQQRAATPERAEPWKTNGRVWHLSQNSIAPKQPRLWDPATLLELIGRIQKLQPAVQIDWTGKVTVALSAGAGLRIGRIVTNRGDGLRVDLHVTKGAFTPTQIEHLGAWPVIRDAGPDTDTVSFSVQKIEQIDAALLATVLTAAAGHRT